MNTLAPKSWDRRWMGWAGLGLAVLYFLTCASLTPVDWELYVTEKIHLWVRGMAPFLDVDWPYGVLPFAVYGLPMRWLGHGLVLQRLLAVATSMAVLIQAAFLLRDLKIERGRWVALALITLVSTSQQFAHSHTLTTFCAITVWRLLARDGAWPAHHWALAAAACTLALANKPLFGGLALAASVPVLAWWLGRLKPVAACLMLLASFVGSMVLGAVILGQPWWLGNWYAPFAAGRTDAILTSMPHPYLAIRIGYLTYFFHEGFTPKNIQFFLTGGFPLIAFDLIMLASVAALLMGRLSRLTTAVLIITAGVGAQVFIMADITLIGYAQEVFPLCFILAAMVARDLFPGRGAIVARFALGGMLLAFATFFSSALYFTSQNPWGTGDFRGVRLLREQVPWEEVGRWIGPRSSAMSLGDIRLLVATYHQGIPDLGSISEAFLLENCFQRPEVDHRIVATLDKWKPEVVLVAAPSASKNPDSRTLRWLREHYRQISPPDGCSVKIHCYERQEPQRAF